MQSTAFDLTNAALFPHQIDLAGRRVLFVRLDPAELRAAPFLDERVLAGRRDGFWAPLAEVVERARALPHRAPHAIFHIGHCGSTLLANLLDRLPAVSCLREPLVLRTLAETREELVEATARFDEPQWRTLFDAFLALLARPHAGIAHTVAKATSSCNALITPWLAPQREARAVLLQIDLESYLATILKSPAARADCARFARARLASLHAALGDDALRLHALAEAEQIALGWLAEQKRFGDAHAREPERLLRVDFADLLDQGPTLLARIAQHLDLPSDPAALDAAWSPQVLASYAKAHTHRYSAADRAADLAESRRRYGAEIAVGLAFADRVRARYSALA